MALSDARLQSSALGILRARHHVHWANVHVGLHHRRQASDSCKRGKQPIAERSPVVTDRTQTLEDLRAANEAAHARTEANGAIAKLLGISSAFGQQLGDGKTRYIGILDYVGVLGSACHVSALRQSLQTAQARTYKAWSCRPR
jgi:hypothetical protein